MIRKLVAAIMVAATLASCSWLGTTSIPQTPRQQLLALEVGYTYAVMTADSFVQSGVIKKESYNSLTATEKAADAALDAADAAILANNPTTIQGALTAAQTALSALTIYLQEVQNGNSTNSH